MKPVLAGLVLGALCACSAAGQTQTNVGSPDSDPAPGYVGRDACRDCHQGNAVNFAGTGMGRSFYPLRPDNVVEDFTDRNEFTDPRSGVTYRMFRRGDRFYQRQFVLDTAGNETAIDEYELTYVVGSNNHSRGYVTLRDGKLFQAPICWDPTEEFWMFCPGFEYQNDHFGREISASCIFCHNGRVEPVAGERNLYREPLAMGIGCERCHGPGSAHLAAREDPPDPWGEPGQADPTIVNPARLPREQRLEVCFQCHLGDTSATVRVVRHGRSLQDFRPGMRITDVLVPFRYEQPTVSSYSLVSQADRMILSRCYLESEGRLECLTCHNPHIPVYERPPGSFRDNCRICHDLQACTATAEARSGTAPPDDCVACHMRRAEPNDRRHSIFTDHWIRRDARTTTPDRRTRYELEPIFPEVFDTYPAGERSYYTGRAHFLRALSSPPPVREWHFDRAAEAFREAIEKDFGVAETWFFLGKILMHGQKPAEAFVAFRQALERDPGHQDAAFAAAQSLAALGRHDEASLVLKGMLERNPDHGLALAELGRLRWTAGRYEQAEELYRRAVRREPWNPQFRLNLGMTLASQGRMDDAVEEALAATRLDPDSPEMWELLFNAAREAGRDVLQAEALYQLDRLRASRR
ncbi:MAG: tetratricopeptide repeat protein [Acidobacteria bacterium]|nr:tetratricopeptide repeat protein [Acidobacteriota bacterium]NIM63313.1 tetratricopeptide repeat protein [Acidobacteriota bacterium]NIO60497.1 tetratricopeptide repeat protein [Acidobacteriota bacterium]NIQ31617.1 tetratricopeptide repeat protein [Acidobacteriota bacterium]NIQ87104.1 tetratricopeptide repeat protein [Acidobacteriota bacterium]